MGYFLQLNFRSDGLDVEETAFVFAITALATGWPLGLVIQTMARSDFLRPLRRHLALLEPLVY